MEPNAALIGERIKTRREELGLSLTDIADEIGVAVSTVMRYEKGMIGKIKMPVINSISKVLEVDPSWLVGVIDEMGPYDKKSASSLTNEALSIAAMYDAAPVIIKSVVRAVLAVDASKETQASTSKPATKIIPLFGARFAAGSPETPGDMEWENFETTNLRADFAIHVNGDSMEPFLQDGSIALGIRRFPKDGEVGAFRLDGEFLVKQYVQDAFGNIHLLSGNRDRADADQTVWRNADRDLTCYGTILCAKIPLV